MRYGVFAGALVATLVACGDNEQPRPIDDGQACTAEDVCISELCVEAFGDGKEIAGGFCTQECTFDGLEDSCPEGQLCLIYTATQEQFCFIECESNDDCRVEDGWKCANFFIAKACIPPL